MAGDGIMEELVQGGEVGTGKGLRSALGIHRGNKLSKRVEIETGFPCAGFLFPVLATYQAPLQMASLSSVPQVSF